MILIDFLKKNKWNIIAILIFFGLCIYYAYDKNIVMASDSLLGAIIWLISCLKKKYSFLGGIALISYAVFILIIRAAGSSRMYSNRIVHLIFLSKET